MSLLTLGMTADAAAAHRHEFSPSSTPTSPSFFSALPFIRTSASDFRIQPRRPTIVLEEPEDSENERQAELRVVTNLNTKDVVEDEEEEEEEGEERVEEERVVLSPTKQRAPRLKTVYQLGYPPPSQSSHRNHLSLLKSKAAPLVQFQRLSNVPRPVPVYDLVSTSTASSILGRSSLKQYGPSVELVLMDSEQYNNEADSKTSGSDNKTRSRSVVAGLSFTSKKGTPTLGQIQLQYGLTWDIRKVPSGFEFAFVDELDTTKRIARWVRRSSRSRRSTLTDPTDLVRAPREDRYIFSILSSTSRKHPILATLTRRRLEIHDSYTAPFELSCPSSPIRNESFQSTTSNTSLETSTSDRSDRAGIPLDQLRLFIYATASWVAMQESFDQSFRGEVRSEAERRCSSPISLNLSRPSSPTVLARGLTHLGHGTPQTPTTPPPLRSATVSSGSSRIVPRRWTGDFHQRSASANLEQSLAALVIPTNEEAVDPPLMSVPLQPATAFLQLPTEPVLNRHSISLAEPATPTAIAPVFRLERASMPPPARREEEEEEEEEFVVERGLRTKKEADMLEVSKEGNGATGLKRKKGGVKRLVSWAKKKIGGGKEKS